MDALRSHDAVDPANHVGPVDEIIDAVVKQTSKV